MLLDMPGSAVRCICTEMPRCSAGWTNARRRPSAPALLLFDAPLICPNATGSRPVDRQTHTLFRPLSRGRAPGERHPLPATVAPGRRARATGFRGRLATLGEASRLAVEVFPHPAMIRLLGLSRIVKYKRGPVAARRLEFTRLQGLLRGCLQSSFPELESTPALEEILGATWTKPAEDRLDAFVCALIGLHHWRHHGGRSEVIGDLKSGFILLPAA